MLTDYDRSLLEFEIARPRHSGVKQNEIRAVFGLSAARYYQHVNRIVDLPAAVVEFPVEVHRLQRARHIRLAPRLPHAGD